MDPHDDASHRARGPFVDALTRWCVLVDEAYPYGHIEFHPATEGGLTVTFPHQSRNEPDRERQGWRGGNLCLDTPFHRERRPATARDPVGDAETRLRWHVERALEWLERAAAGNLLAPGDPFELPACPHTTLREWAQLRVVHDEPPAGFIVWAGRQVRIGRVRFGIVEGLGNAIVVATFNEQDGQPIRHWSGRIPTLRDDVSGVWWLWPEPIVVPPWQSPSTWGELRKAAKPLGLDIDVVLRQLVPSLRGAKSRSILLLGYPISARVGEPPGEVHWDAVLLPQVPPASGKPPSGFRANARGWWQRDRQGAFGDNARLECLLTENWSRERLQARGRLPVTLRDTKVAILGVGALGSSLAEQLVRAGVTDITLVDFDRVAAGNVCRHTATLADVGKRKVSAVAQRLRGISPAVVVTEVHSHLNSAPSTAVEALEPCDVVVDCTASNDVLYALANGWWAIPRIFTSFSMGFGAKRLFSFGILGHAFPYRLFVDEVQPWLEDEATTWASEEELLEGAGCWAPLFPARCDDVLMAAAVCVKELEALSFQRPREPRFRVFEKRESADGFDGFCVRRGHGPPGAVPS